MKRLQDLIRRRSLAPQAAAPGAQPLDAAPPAGAEQTGAEPEPALPASPGSAARGRLRRRLRYLRRVRELGLRDVGGLVFDQHRFDQRRPELVDAKLAALAAVDAELRAIERVLGERRDVVELREPGISVCLRCGTLHGSDARFCPSCGVPLHGPRAMAGIGSGLSDAIGQIGPVTPALGAQPVAATQRTPQPQPQAAAPPAAPAAPAPVQAAEAQPDTAQPATAQPATAQPATAQPATAQPATAHPPAAGPGANDPQPTVAMPAVPRESSERTPGREGTARDGA